MAFPKIGKREAKAHMIAIAFGNVPLDPSCATCIAAFEYGMAYPDKELQ